MKKSSGRQPSPSEKRFGRHIRSLRKARGLTQEQLAERAGLAPDTIRRLEHGSFSPSVNTLEKVCVGFNLRMSRLFEGAEYGEDPGPRDLIEALSVLNRAELRALREFIKVLGVRLEKAKRRR